MRPVLFALQPLGTGRVHRSLVIAEILKSLFKAIEPRFVAGPSAVEILNELNVFPVERTLTPVMPQASDAGNGQAAERRADHLAGVNAKEVCGAAERLKAELVVADGLYAVPAALRRKRIDSVFLTDDLLDAGIWTGGARRGLAAIHRRSVVTSSRLRFFLGEPSYLASPELRVWSRKHFRFIGPVSGLARLPRGDAATLRDEFGLRQERVVVIAAGGSAYAMDRFQLALRAAEILQQRVTELKVITISGPELKATTQHAQWDHRGRVPELYRYFAVADLCVVPGGLSCLAECAGLGVPTITLPIQGHAQQQRNARFFAERYGVVLPEEPTPESLADTMKVMLAASWRDLAADRATHTAPDGDQQRSNAQFAADLIAELLGRRRPSVPVARG